VAVIWAPVSRPLGSTLGTDTGMGLWPDGLRSVAEVLLPNVDRRGLRSAQRGLVASYLQRSSVATLKVLPPGGQYSH